MDSAALPRLVSDVLSPARFVAHPALRLTRVHSGPQPTTWEVYLGHLLGPGQTRQQLMLESWGLVATSDVWEAQEATGGEESQAKEPRPLVQVAWDAAERLLYVVRHLQIHGWEPQETAPGVITSHPARRWQPELIGVIEVARRESAESLADELAHLVELALVGVSRLPITSVESPVPAFACGQLAYLPALPEKPPAAPLGPTWQAALERALSAASPARAARGFEFALRSAAPADARQIAAWLAGAQAVAATNAWFRKMFQQVSLAPHTQLLDTLVELLRELATLGGFGVAAAADLVSFMLRHLVRHLTAYDLVTFHSFGANFPDALWLDALLRLYLDWIDGEPRLCGDSPADSPAERLAARLRRRALRQAWLTRLRYEGLPVPDVPTSQGERLRVLPGHDTIVPEQQVLDPSSRQRRLFADDPLAPRARGAVAELLAHAWRDVEDPRELLELGTATFVDRPFGLFKDPGEVDRTPLLAYEAISVRRAEDRLRQARAAGLLADDRLDPLLEQLRATALVGFRVTELPGSQRPGVITLEDARQASDDFVIVRTTQGSLAELAAWPNGWNVDQRQRLRDWAANGERQLLIRTASPRAAAGGQPLLTHFDSQLRPTTWICVVPPADDDPVYREAWGVEYLAAGLRFATPT